MNHSWSLVWDVGCLSVLLLIATVLKRKIRFFERFLVPNSIIAGLLGFALVSLWPSFPALRADSMEELVYHLLNISFIALAFKNTRKLGGSEISSTGAFIVSGYLLQGIIGFALSIVLAGTLFPDLFPGFGLLLPLGFGQGPGQATAIGGQWEATPGLGFANGGNIGMTIAAIGFLWACFAGVPFLNWLSRRGKRKAAAPSDVRLEPDPAAALPDEYKDTHSDIALSESIDRLTFQCAVIGAVYLVSYGLVYGLNLLLAHAGSFGQTIGNMLWGFLFIFGSLVAMLARLFCHWLVRRGLMKRNYIDNYILQRIAGGCFDFLVAASIAGISLFVLAQYLWPTLIVTTVGGVATLLYIYWAGRYIYRDSPHENMVGLFGNLTGTMSSGMSLIKELDPTLQSSAPTNLVYGSGVAMLFGFPLMILLNLPIQGYLEGNGAAFAVTLILFAVYFAALWGFIVWNTKRQLKRDAVPQNIHNDD